MSRRYKNEAYDDTDVLKKVIAKINDTDLLGSAIYSKCSIIGHGKESRFYSSPLVNDLF